MINKCNFIFRVPFLLNANVGKVKTYWGIRSDGGLNPGGFSPRALFSDLAFKGSGFALKDVIVMSFNGSARTHSYLDYIAVFAKD